MEKYPLQLKSYSFPVQISRANQEFDPQGELNGTKTSNSFIFVKADDNDQTWFAQMTVATDVNESVNPPYFYEIHAFGIFQSEIGTDEQIINSAGQVECFQVLTGAIRERIAELTSRAPWGQHTLDIIPFHINTES